MRGEHGRTAALGCGQAVFDRGCVTTRSTTKFSGLLTITQSKKIAYNSIREVGFLPALVFDGFSYSLDPKLTFTPPTLATAL